VAQMVARARVAQKLAEAFDQAQVDELVLASAWAIMEPARNQALAQLAVEATGIGNVPDKVRKNYRKTLGLLRDLKGAKSVGVIAHDAALGVTEIARPVGVSVPSRPRLIRPRRLLTKLSMRLKGVTR
jgi:sulfoacetaldehyde dehydrogenase